MNRSETGRHDLNVHQAPMFASSWLALFAVLRHGVTQQHRRFPQRSPRASDRNGKNLV
jgi:hypothetical protein